MKHGDDGCDAAVVVCKDLLIMLLHESLLIPPFNFCLEGGENWRERKLEADEN